MIASQQLQPILDGADCARCPMSKDGLPGRFVPTEQHVNSPVAIIGEGPSRREIQYGRPFVGPSGELLQLALSQSGYKRSDFTVANIVGCGILPSDREDIKQLAAECCRPRLFAELKRLRPKTVLALGGTALKTLSAPNTPNITAARGALVEFTPEYGEDRPILFSSFHPAHILRGGDGEQENDSKSVDVLFYFLVADVIKAVRFAKGEVRAWQDVGRYFIHDEIPGLVREVKVVNGQPAYGPHVGAREIIGAFETFRDEAYHVGYVASDTETTGKDSLECELTSISFALQHTGVSATWPLFTRHAQLFAIAKELNGSLRVEKIFHNSIYDRIVLRRHGLALQGIVQDTLLAHHAAFPGLPHKLDQVASQYFVTAPWKAEFRNSIRDLASLTVYNERDSRACAYLLPALEKAIEINKTAKVYEVDRQLVSVATYMRETGFYVDRNEQARQGAVQKARAAYMRQNLTDEVKALEEPWRKALAQLQAQKRRKKDPENYEERVRIRYQAIATRDRGASDIGLFKPTAKLDLVCLFQVLRIDVGEFTKTGLPITDKKAMEGAALTHPLMRKLLHLREALKLDATFVSGLPIKRDGRVHPDWSVTKITGRWSAGKTQNVPYNVPGWPPEKDAQGRFKVTPSGEWITSKENPRAQVSAPTALQILAIPSNLLHPKVYLRALGGRGRVLAGADFSALELKIAAWLSGDEFLLDIFKRNEDPHAIFAKVCFKAFDEIDEEFKALKISPKAELDAQDLAETKRTDLKRKQKLWKRLRDLAKRGEYGGIYGGKALTIWTSLVKEFPEVTLANVEEMLRVILEKMSGVVKWRLKQEEFARKNRQIREALFGRVRLFPLGNFDPSVVYNFPITAVASSLLARGIFRFTALTQPYLLQLDRLFDMGILEEHDRAWISEWDNRLFDYPWHAPAWICVNGHDSLLVESDEEDGERIRFLLEDSMTQTLTYEGRVLTFDAKAKLGRRWSEV